jgi:hypothetical protein
MIGFAESGTTYILHVIVVLLMSNVGSSLALLLGIIAKNSTVAFALVPVTIIPLLVFSGFLINNDNVPKYFIWASYISPMRWGFQAAMLNIFNDLTFTCVNPAKCFLKTGADVLTFYKLNEGPSYAICCFILLGIYGFLRVCAFIALLIAAKLHKATA